MENSDLYDSSGNPFFTEVTDVTPLVSVGLLAESPAILVKTDAGGKFFRLTAPEAVRLAECVKMLAG